MKRDILIVSAIVLITAIMRVVNAEFGLYHFVPVAALGLFSGAALHEKKWAYAIPLASMLLSDIGFELFTQTPGFYGVSQWVNYGALALVTWLGTTMQNRNLLRVAGYTLSGSLLFFIISNFGSFLQGWYGYSAKGLVTCYTMAIPFYKSELATQLFTNSLIGDLIFSAIAFGLLTWIQVQKTRLSRIA